MLRTLLAGRTLDVELICGKWGWASFVVNSDHQIFAGVGSAFAAYTDTVNYFPRLFGVRRLVGAFRRGGSKLRDKSGDRSPHSKVSSFFLRAHKHPSNRDDYRGDASSYVFARLQVIL